jgi:hypothetical protein
MEPTPVDLPGTASDAAGVFAMVLLMMVGSRRGESVKGIGETA